MLITNLKSGVFAALLVATVGIGWGCSVSATDAGGGDCVSRCTAIADKCGGSSSKCDETCEKVTSKQLTCIEDADCDDDESIACLVSSDGSDDTSTTTKEDAGPGSTGDDCVDRCNALATKCKSKTNHCERDCPKISETQLACLEGAGCDSTAQLSCLMPATDGGSSGAGAFASYVYETSSSALEGYAPIVDDYVMKLSLYIRADGSYIVYYREGKGANFSGGVAEQGSKLTGKWTVSGSTLTVGDVLECVKATTVTCELKKDIEPQIIGIKVPMTGTNAAAPDSTTEWKAYTK